MSLKHKHAYILLCLLACLLLPVFGLAADQYYEKAIYTDEYGLSFYPDYPPRIGQTVTLRLRTFKPAEKVTMFSDREAPIPLIYRQGHWWGKYTVPADYQEGGHFFTIWLRYPFQPEQQPSWLEKFVLRRKPESRWHQTQVWYQAFKASTEAGAEKLPSYLPLAPDISAEAEDILPLPVTGEAVELLKPATLEAGPLKITGSQTIAFKTRSLEGSKEGYTPGSSQTREETLRINVAGLAADTTIEASLYRTSASGITQIGEREEQISILLRRGSLEAFLGDFTADFTDTEFTRLNKVLSGGRVTADFTNWGAKALYSSPKGQEKFTRLYGNNTQGPFQLASAPVVINSERVYVDGVLLRRGDDYTIDYRAGTVSFLQRIIDYKSVINIYYDFRQTLYSHATYGWRSYYKPLENLQLAATYLEDSDSLAGAAEIRQNSTGEAVNPKKHYVIGSDLAYNSENFKAVGEAAVSYRDLDLLSSSSTKESGKAAKVSFSSNLGLLGLEGQAKKVGLKFQPAAEPLPKQDVWEYGLGLSFRPGTIFGSQGNYEYQKYLQSNAYYENLFKSAKFQLVPDNWPALNYTLSEITESNDPVTAAPISRVITKNGAEANYQLGFVSASLKNSNEQWLRRSPSEEVTNYQRINFGLAAIGLERVTLATNIEQENRQEPGGLEPFRRTYNLNLSLTPVRNYFVAGSFNIVDDSQLGRTDVLDLSYRLEPDRSFKTDGKFTITSVKEDFQTTAEAVARQNGSFSFDWRPLTELRLRYLFKPNFTRLNRTGTLSYSNDQRQAEVQLIPWQQLLLGLVYKTGAAYNVYKKDYPNYAVKDNSLDSASALYTLKFAPHPIWSTEFNYLLEDSTSLTLTSTDEPWNYLSGRAKGVKFDALIKTSWSERFSLDSRYTYQKADQGTGEALSSQADTKNHTASLKGNWRPDDNWTFSASGAYARTTDERLNTLTYTLTPGVGFIYRLAEQLRLDFDYTYARSYAAAATARHNYSLRTKYALSDFVDVTVRADREISRAPDYSLTDITANVEITL